MRRFAFLLVALLTWPAFAQETDAVAATVRGFYRAYAAGDVNAAKELWTADGAPGFVAREARRLRVRCLRLDALDVRDLHVDGEAASATAEARITPWSAMPSSVPEPERARATLQLRREHGSWRIASWIAAEDELADRVAATLDRDALVAEPSLWNRRLVVALVRRAVTAHNRDENERAPRVTALAREVAESIGDSGALAEVLGMESVLQRHNPINDEQRGARTALEAVAVAEEAHDPDILARALLRRGNAQLGTGDRTDVESFDRLLALADFVEQPATLALAASGLTRSHLRDSRLRDALRAATVAVDWAKDTGDPAAMISAEMTLAGSYLERRDTALTLPHALRAAEISRQAGFDSIRVSALRLVALAYNIDDNEEMVGRVLDEALDHAEDQDVRTRIEMLVHRVGHRQRTGDAAGAEKDLAEAKVIAAGNPDQPDMRWLEVITGWLRLEQGRYDEAMQHLDRADAFSPGADVTRMRAGVLVAMGRPAEARETFEDALQWEEHVGTSIDDPIQRLLFMGGRTHLYTSLVQLLVDIGQTREALAVAERMKARALRERLTGDRSTVKDASVSEINAQVTALNRQLLAIERDGGNPSAVLVRLREARGALEEAESRAEVPRPAAPPAALYDLRTLRVPDDTVVLDYVIGVKKTVVFAARAEGGDVRVKTRVIEIDRRRLREMVRDFTRQIEQRDVRYQPAARELYDLLVAPLLGATPSGTNICIIPDADLWTLPFQALIAGDGRHLIEHAVVYYAPSLETLEAARRPHPQRAPTLLAMGDPDIDREIRGDLRSLGATGLGRLPDAEREVRALGRIYGARATVRTGPAAEEALLKKHGGDYDVVHLATHGIVDEHSPMYSSLLLAGSATEDGLLEAREIVDLPLRAQLVVLSACDTARGRIISGEGVLGVSWAILATGTPRTIATQWPISSAAAARLMIAFHQRLAKRTEIANVAEALREAQLEMLHGRDSAHPHYWAAFVLIGSDQ